LNGVDLVATPAEKFLTFLRLANGEVSEEELAEWIGERIKKADDR
jgi:prophage maintenance system killer protein